MISSGLALGLLQACAHSSMSGHTEHVDRKFIATEMRLNELQETVTDIKTRHDGSTITVLVKYYLQQPFSASAELAQSQGDTVKEFLQKNEVKAPIKVMISPAQFYPNHIWISYSALSNKGDGIYLEPAASSAKKLKPISAN